MDSNSNYEDKNTFRATVSFPKGKMQRLLIVTSLGNQTDFYPPLTHRGHCDKRRILQVFWNINLSVPQTVACSCQGSGLYSGESRKSCKTNMKKKNKVFSDINPCSGVFISGLPFHTTLGYLSATECACICLTTHKGL